MISRRDQNKIDKNEYNKKKLDLICFHLQSAIISWNREGKIIDWNRAAEELFGWKKEEIIGRDFLTTLIVDKDRDKWKKIQDKLYSKVSNEIKSEAVDKKGNFIICRWKNFVIKEEENIKEIISIGENISQEIDKENKISNLIKAINETDNWVVITDPDGNIEYANTTVEDVTGYKKEEIIGKNPSIFKSGKHKKSFYKNMWETIKSGNVFNDILINKKRNGELFYSEQTITPIQSDDGELLNFISVGKDITKNEKLRKKLIYISNYDISSGLPNKRAFKTKLEKLIEFEEEKVKAVFVISISDVKYFNDIYRKNDDEKNFIRAAADWIMEYLEEDSLLVNIDENYFISYLEGNEFALLVNDFDSSNDIYGLAEKIIEIFKNPIVFNNEYLMLSVKIGISLYPEDDTTAEELISKAEIATITISKNRYAFFDEKNNIYIKKYSKMEAEMKRALEKDEFLLYYQPYYNGKTEEVFAAEALLRWRDPNKGIISPAEFIPVLEESGMIIDVGLLVVKKVLEMFYKIENNNINSVPLSINLSPIQLNDSAHLESIFEIVSDSNISSDLITFEITESSVMENVQYTFEIMKKMKENKFSISIDDFGTGYSSLSYLQKFPVDFLKIDLSFIQNMRKGKEAESIVEFIIKMAHLLGMKTIAEGVENKFELKKLNSYNNDFIQGFYFSPPLEEDKFISYLLKEKNR
ncbi:MULTISPECIES: bifunctional diguanylate cyclase/phosphodiesterase [unclassified Halanaerobium]|uniref:bifunctional diguanylate cyclase/phosphodiesterase n=1 Tax=unclassified Halanaerobium TaxID=2641197 RepID=UPI000DF35D64|nr:MULTISPECIES: bifunctional diguanylate cyclase/phosphodiesterase [unclassified Halanaerobium]RCW51435.1 diguanylate cyclase/phosphodiesterase with PAS/PAC sensor(s) [Halanaerobium sp. MA284_MarDTE_T2]RCW89223.1 diguanylate cyclase/phosphodiesterase with PAS/PAC sensor(s) [Halanaerobium sp. DL-01]